MTGFLLLMWFNRKVLNFQAVPLGVSACFLGYLITLAHPVCCRTKGHALFWYLYSPLYPEYLKINFNAFEITNCSLSFFNSSLPYPFHFNLCSSVLPKPQQTLIFLNQREKWIPEWRKTLGRASPWDKPASPCQPAAAELPTASQCPSSFWALLVYWKRRIKT